MTLDFLFYSAANVLAGYYNWTDNPQKFNGDELE